MREPTVRATSRAAGFSGWSADSTPATTKLIAMPYTSSIMRMSTCARTQQPAGEADASERAGADRRDGGEGEQGEVRQGGGHDGAACGAESAQAPGLDGADAQRTPGKVGGGVEREPEQHGCLEHDERRALLARERTPGRMSARPRAIGRASPRTHRDSFTLSDM
jgi:hypothetical protein